MEAVTENQYRQQIPEWLKEAWEKQSAKPYENLVINAGADEGLGQDLGKTSFDESQMNNGSPTVMFYKTGENIDELLQRDYPFDVAVVRGLKWNIKNRYDLPEYREKELLSLLEDGYSSDTVKNFLPDNGEKFDDQIPLDRNGNLKKPVATVHSMLQHKGLKEAMKYGVWEENPHKPFEDNWDMNRRELSDCRELFDLPEDMEYMFRKELNNLWIQVLMAEREVTERHGKEKISKRQIRYQTEENDYIHRIEEIGWKFHINIFERVYDWIERVGKLTGKIVEAIGNKNREKARKLRKFKANLRALKNFYGSNKICINWQIQGKELEWGRSPFDRKRSIATTWTQALEELYDCEADICVNYAEATDPLIRKIVPDYEWFTVEAEKSKAELTALKHRKDGGSFAKSKMKEYPKRIQRAKNILKALEHEGNKVGVVTYQEFTDYFSDFPCVYYGNHKGSNELEECDAVATVGTPNLPSYGLEFQHLLFFGEFSGFSKYGKQYEESEEKKSYFPNELLETNFSLEGFKDRRMNLIFQHCVLKELRDATQRLRNQRESEGENKHLLVFGFCPDLIWDNYEEEKRKRTDTVTFMSGKLGEIAEAKGEVPDAIQELPCLPVANLPDNLWLDGDKIVKKRDEHFKQAEIKDYIRKNGKRKGDRESGKLECDWKEIRGEISGTNSDIKKAIEKSDIEFGRWGRKKTVYMKW
jgi:hypothetical protein